MNISISAVSRNRKFTKALVRHASALNDLRNAAVGVNTGELPYDTLQVVFIDRDQDYVRAAGCKGDRLFQVEVAAPDETTTDYTNQSSFLAAISDKLRRAVEISGLPLTCREEIAESISSIGGI
jgi:hypothetical protein